MKKGLVVIWVLITVLGSGCMQSQQTADSVQSNVRQTTAGIPAADPVDAYLLVVDDLFNQNTNLNGNAEYLAIDCSAMVNLTAEGRNRLLAELEKYGLKILDKSMDQLKTEGYITNLSFENGIYFEIKDQPMSESTILMTAMKWRSGLGAIGWENRTVSWQNNSWALDESKETWVS